MRDRALTGADSLAYPAENFTLGCGVAMLNTLEKVISVLTALAAIAYSLGWLKTASYFQAFGIGLSSLDLTVQDYLFESWYVVENVVFFVLFSWVLKAGFRLHVPSELLRWAWRVLLALLGLVYLVLPLATERALAHLDGEFSGWLVAHYYSVLKFLPFAVYLLVIGVAWLSAVRGQWNWQTVEEAFRIPKKGHLLVVYVVVLLGWSVSLAKHVGAIDADNVMRSPAKYLARVTLHIAPDNPDLEPLETNQQLYGLYESPKKYFIWDTTGFAFRQGEKARIVVIPREQVEWIDASKALQVGPGALFF